MPSLENRYALVLFFMLAYLFSWPIWWLEGWLEGGDLVIWLGSAGPALAGVALVIILLAGPRLSHAGEQGWGPGR